MCLAFYRLWASTRLRQLNGWISKWKDDALFAGVPQVGALDAWYSQAIMFEEANLDNKAASGASTDIYKCFDQINRELIYLLALRAGMPPPCSVRTEGSRKVSLPGTS